MILKAIYDKTLIVDQARLLLQTEGKLSAARYIAEQVFASTKDKSGEPYLGHLERVSNNIKDRRYAHDGYLHDLFEMHSPHWDEATLLSVGFNQEDADTIRTLSHPKTEKYFDYVVRCGAQRRTADCKLGDLQDNMNPARIPRHAINTAKTLDQKLKYLLCHHYLNDIQEGTEQPGTAFHIWMDKQPGNMKNSEMLLRYSDAYKNRPPKAAPEQQATP